MTFAAIAAPIVGSLLGGIFGRESEKDAIRDQNRYNAPDQVRARAEKAGFNPLLFVAPGVGQQTATGGGNYMGEAIANAGLALADGLHKKQMMDVEKSLLAMDRQKHDMLIQNATIWPKSGGISGQSLAGFMRVTSPLPLAVVLGWQCVCFSSWRRRCSCSGC